MKCIHFPSHIKCGGVFSRTIIPKTVGIKFVSEFMCELPKNRIVPKCPVCGLSGLRRKRNAAFPASQEYVTVQVLKGLKCAVVCYFQGRMFHPTNLSNHVVPFIELMMQM